MEMTDMEKVIEAFDEAKELVWTDDDEYTVGYNNGLEAGKNIAISMLKEQEAVEPIRISTNYEQHWKCGNCKAVISVQDKFCHECGQAVKWK